MHPDSERTCCREQGITAPKKPQGLKTTITQPFWARSPGSQPQVVACPEIMPREPKREGSSAPGTMTKSPLLTPPQP